MNTHNNQLLESILSNIPIANLIKMLDILPDTLFWIKDTQSRFIHANSLFLDHIGVKHVSQIMSKTDEAFSSHYLAKQFMLDDQKVMQGELITDRLELNMLRSGEYGWFSTSKRPLVDCNDNIIGSYGFTQHLEKTSRLLSNIGQINIPVDFIRNNYHNEISVAQLANISYLSISALERRFKKHLGKTPKQFVNQVRLENARRLIIETNKPISDISEQCGFAEHSYFSKQFKALFGMAPTQLRTQSDNS